MPNDAVELSKTANWGAHSSLWRYWPYPYGAEKWQICNIMIYQEEIQIIQSWKWFRLIPTGIPYYGKTGIWCPISSYGDVDLPPMGREMSSVNCVDNYKKTSYFFGLILILVDAQWCRWTFQNSKLGCSQLVMEILTFSTLGRKSPTTNEI